MKLTLTDNAIAQMAHVGWGALLTLAPAVMFHKSAWYFAVAVVIGAAAKEYADAHGLESEALAGNSWEDWSYWCVGGALGLGVFFIGKI
jgi:hypothetical protein